MSREKWCSPITEVHITQPHSAYKQLRIHPRWCRLLEIHKIAAVYISRFANLCTHAHIWEHPSVNKYVYIICMFRQRAKSKITATNTTMGCLIYCYFYCWYHGISVPVCAYQVWNQTNYTNNITWCMWPYFHIISTNMASGVDIQAVQRLTVYLPTTTWKSLSWLKLALPFWPVTL